MIPIVNELIQVTRSHFWEIALNIALLLPDTCTRLESVEGKSNGKEYMHWFDKYCTPRFNGTISGKDIYTVRCNSMDTVFQRPDFGKITFELPGDNIAHNKIVGHILMINLAVFIDIVIDGYKSWWKENKENLYVQSNLSNKRFSLKYKDYFEWNY